MIKQRFFLRSLKCFLLYLKQESCSDKGCISQEPEDEIIKSGVKPDNIRKWKVLQSLQDRNETLFYRLGIFLK